MSDKKPTYEELESQVKYLKSEFGNSGKTDYSLINFDNPIDFHTLFDINEIQRIQDLFAEATGVASIITFPNGIPITKPSNFCRLCNDIIRKTKKGLNNCYRSDAIIGKENLHGAIFQPCLSGGLCDGGASISVGGKHIANWLIGQVKNELTDEKKILQYSKEIGVDEGEFKKALDEVTTMPIEKFKKIADVLFYFANEISQKAYHNLLQKHLIDELKSKEETLIKANEKALGNYERLQSIFRVAPAGIGLTKNRIIIEVNQFVCNLLGYKQEELVGQDSLILYPTIEDYEFVGREKYNQIKLFETGSVETRWKKKNGEIIDIILASTPLDISDISKGVTFTVIDITMQNKIQRELIWAKEKAENSDRLKTEFLNNMSHEIRTPMNGIIGFSRMLDKPDLPEIKRKYYSKIIQNCSQQLLRIIDDILEISTLETKQEKINETEFCLNDLLMDLFSIVNLKSKERNIPLYLKKALHDDQSHIISDKTRINKILGNLLENSMKFTNEGFIELGYYLEKQNLVLYVKDTGIGISPKNQKIIFERFSQEDNEISYKHGGLGLGLSISRENAQLLGGDITLESEKGKGATFFVTIPHKPAHKENTGSFDLTSERTTDNSKYTILVAEDEEVNYLYIEAIFEEKTYSKCKLIHAKNGKEAVDLCLENRNICVVLMDIKMPIMNGYKATEKIKSQLPHLPIIAQTAYSTESDKNLALKHGCDGFISKPINKEELFKMINKYCRIKK